MSTNTLQKASANRSRPRKRRIDIKKWILLAFLWALALLFLAPIYYLVISTFKDPEAVATAPFALPSKLDFSQYVKAWNEMQYPRAFMNTFIITTVSVLCSTVLAATCAYSVSRYRSKLNNLGFMLILSSMMIPGQVSLVSLYKLVRDLGLMNKLLGIIIINSSCCVVQPLFLIRGFISTTIPKELEEAAAIDGCSIPQTFFRIVLPLLKPILATVIIINTMGIWNDFLNPMLFLHSRENQTILLEIYRNVGQFSTDWTSMFPMLVLGMAPLAIFYLFMQKYIINGVVSGAVKG